MNKCPFVNVLGRADKYFVYSFLALSLLMSLFGPAEAEADKPIIANLFADSERYYGRPVTIYGLVIESSKNGQVFMLQDVSQIPLRIIRSDGTPSKVGDQILVQGMFLENDGQPYFKARKIIQTKVLGGGGCC